MAITTLFTHLRRHIAQVVEQLPQPLRDRLLALRIAHPTTPLQSLPEPVRAEVKCILTTATTGTDPATRLPPTLQSTMQLPATQHTRLHPPLPGTSQHPAMPQAHSRTGHPNGATARYQHPDTSALLSVLGTDLKTRRPVAISQKARQQGLYAIGANGTGKTTLLAHLILSDIRQGLGICLIEPHGDLTKTVLAGIPEYRLKDVVYLDAEDYEHPFGLNLFECPEPRTLGTMAATAAFISHVFETLWNTGFETPRLMQNLRAVTRTLIETPGATFAEIPLLYEHVAVRHHLLAQVTNPQILTFWEAYNRRTQREKDELSASTLNKVTAFLDEPMIRHILAQTKTTINFRTIMDESKILLVRLSPQFEEASRLIGSVIIGKLLMAAFSRADTPEQNRRQFNLYCDEFQRFASSDFATLISEARKFRISTTLSHQTLMQLSEANRAAALAAGNLIVFRVSGEDARVLSQSFDTTPTTNPYVIGEEAIRAPTNDTINFLLRKAHTNPAAMALNRYLEYLLHFAGFSVPHPPVHTPRGHYPNPRGNKAESVLEGMGDAVAVMLCNFSDRRKYRKAQGLVTAAQTCILTLNEYFAEVMLRRDPTLPIPQEVIALFGHREFLNGNVGHFLASLHTVVAALATAPILVETGQYRPRLQNRT